MWYFSVVQVGNGCRPVCSKPRCQLRPISQISWPLGHLHQPRSRDSLCWQPNCKSPTCNSSSCEVGVNLVVKERSEHNRSMWRYVYSCRDLLTSDSRLISTRGRDIRARGRYIRARGRYIPDLADTPPSAQLPGISDLWSRTADSGHDTWVGQEWRCIISGDMSCMILWLRFVLEHFTTSPWNSCHYRKCSVVYVIVIWDHPSSAIAAVVPLSNLY